MAIDVSTGMTVIADSAVAITTVGVSILAVLVLIAAYAWIRKPIGADDQAEAWQNDAESHHGGESDDTIPCMGCADLFPESELDAETGCCASCFDYSVANCEHCGHDLNAEEAGWSECPFCDQERGA